MSADESARALFVVVDTSTKSEVQMWGTKTLVNNVGSAIMVELFTREGADPSKERSTVNVSLESGDVRLVVYGDETNPFLNGVGTMIDSGDALNGQQGFVIVRGGAYDNLLNMNDTLVFTMTDHVVVTGRNSQ